MKRLFLFLIIGSLAVPPFGAYAQVTKPEITSFKTSGGAFLVETQMETLSWSSQNATYCIASGEWSGTKDPSGSFNYYPSTIGSVNYQLACYDGLGNNSAPSVLTPFVGSSGSMKQKGSIAVVSAKVTSSDPENTVIVVDMTQTPSVASLVFTEQTAGPHLKADVVSMFFPSTAISGQRLTFAVDGQTKLKAGASYSYTITAQGANTTDLTTYQGSLTVTSDAPKILISDITLLPSDTSVSVTWKTNIPAGSSVEYQKGSEQANFAFSEQEYPQTFHKVTIKDLKPDTEYKATAHAYIHNDKKTDTTSKADPLTFRTISSAPDILISDVIFMPSDTSASVTWKTNIPAGSSVEYQKGSEQANFAFSEQEYPQTFHKVTIKDLKPDTEYKATAHAYIHHDGKQDTTKKLDPVTFRTRSSTAATSQFKISSIKIDKLDALGKATEEERSFGISVSHPFSKITISIWEAPNTSITQPPYTSFTTPGNGSLTSIYVSPGGFDKKLRPNTTYYYRIIAYKYGAAEDMNTTVGDTFTTTNFAAKTEEKPATVSLEGRVYKAGDEPYETLYRDFGVSYQNSLFNGKLTKTLIVYEQPQGTVIAKKDLTTEHSFVSGLKPSTSYRYVYEIIDERGVKGVAEGTFQTGVPPKAKEEEKKFSIISVRVEKQTQSGSKEGEVIPLEQARDFYPTFSESAKQVKLDVYRKTDNTLTKSYSYPEQFVTADKTSFSLSADGLDPLTPYRFVITGRSQKSGELARFEDTFTTADFSKGGKKEERIICGQAITYGKNNVSGEVKAFPTTCIPDGWVVVSLETPSLDTRDQQTRDIESKVKLLVDRNLDTVFSELQELRSKVKEQETELKYLRKISSQVSELREEMQDALKTFVTYGVDSNTKNLGAGERAAVVRSYQTAYGKLPDSEKELEDMIRIANGRFPSERNSQAEQQANTEFKRIFKRVANLKNNNDRAAIMVMAYGLRQAAENRNMNSESHGVMTFKAVYGHVPGKTEEWNIMQAVTYSGASRKKDSDKDLLADEDEKDYGTDPANPDTDGDGFADGLEVESGYSPVS